jgi:hypothetical protein
MKGNMDSLEGSDRERELLRRILQYDIRDAIARYEGEMGVSVSNVTLTITTPDECSLELRSEPGAPQAGVPRPIPRMLGVAPGR